MIALSVRDPVQRKKPLSPSLALPLKHDYWPLLALKLITAAFTYSLAIGLITFAVSAPSIDWSIDQVLFPILGWAAVLFFGPAAFAGLVALICIFFLPLAGWLATRASVVRPGRLVGTVVATIAVAPMWASLPWERGLGVARPLLFSLLITVPAILLFQAAGLLAAPGDVVRRAASRHSFTEFRFSIGRLMLAVTVASVVSAMVALSSVGAGLAVLLVIAATIHWLGRRPVESVTRWQLARRFARRRAHRLAARST